MSESIVVNCDCMKYMRRVPDKAFNLAVVDPPYFRAGKAWLLRQPRQQNRGSSRLSHIPTVEYTRCRVF